MKMKQILTIAGIMLMIAACTSKNTTQPVSIPSESAPTILRLSGSGSVTAIMRAVADDFSQDVSGYELEVLTGSGTGGGVRGVVDGILDVAAMARPPRDEEADQGIQYVQFGIGGVAVLVHPDVAVTNLTSEQVVAIYSGELTNWSDVGGADIPINVYVRDEDDSSTRLMREHILGELELDTEFVQVLTSQSDMLASVSTTPGAIGFGTWPTALALETAVIGVSLDGINPDDVAYPMQVTLGIGFLEDRSEDIQPLVAWLQSETGKTHLEALAIRIES